MNLIPLNLVFEDQLSEFLMTKIADQSKKYTIANSYSEGGFGYIKRNMKGWNQAAKSCSFFILTDLDTYECPSVLIKDWLQEERNPNLIFRVAVIEAESWLLADVEGFSKFIGISSANFVNDVESIKDPKTELLRLTKRSRKRSVREDILPINEFAKIGPNYNDRLCEFVINDWNISRAMERSKSLAKAVLRLSEFKEVYHR